MEHYDIGHDAGKLGAILTTIGAIMTLTDIDIIVRIAAGIIACVVGVLTARYYIIKINKEKQTK